MRAAFLLTPPPPPRTVEWSSGTIRPPLPEPVATPVRWEPVIRVTLIVKPESDCPAQALMQHAAWAPFWERQNLHADPLLIGDMSPRMARICPAVLKPGLIFQLPGGRYAIGMTSRTIDRCDGGFETFVKELAYILKQRGFTLHPKHPPFLENLPETIRPPSP